MVYEVLGKKYKQRNMAQMLDDWLSMEKLVITILYNLFIRLHGSYVSTVFSHSQYT